MAITLRSVKGSPLTWAEADDNFREVQTLIDKAYVSIKDFGAVGDGVTNDDIAVLAAEASPHTYIDLVGCAVYTTLTKTQISKNYFNGTITYKNSATNQTIVKNTSPFIDTEIQRPRTKSPRIEWEGKRVLWLGTSIPHQGGNTDSYCTLFGAALNCTVDNLAWSGSKASYDINDDPFDLATVKSLSMTEDDRLAGLALYGPTSAYDDSFDLVTKASKMTCNYRIQDQFALHQYDCVMLDHNHNDRKSDFGILNPTTTNITAVTIGVTTTFTSAGHGLVVGDAVILRITGIDNLDYAAGRVQSVSGNDFVLNIDSSTYTGTFTSGTVAKVDRNTLCGAWNFLISFIKNCSIVYGNSDCDIVLSGAPNEYTAGDTKPYEVYSNANYIKQIATKWDLSFFDIGFYYDIKPHDVPIYFSDGYHPTDVYARQSLANYWVTWAQGGASKQLSKTDFLQAGADKTFINQREAIYTKYLDGFGTPKVIIGDSTNLITDSFSSLSGWTTDGTPTAGSAPWGVGNAVQFDVASETTESISKDVVFTNGTTIEFDLYVPTSVGLTTGLPKTVGICQMNLQPVGYAGGNLAGVQLIITATSIGVRGYVFTSSGVINYIQSSIIDVGVKYTIRLEVVQGTSTYNGAVLLYIDNILVGGKYDLDFATYYSLPQSLELGINSNNLGAFELYIGNLVVDSLGVHDYTNRYTGTYLSGDSPAKTVTVVNGIITGVA